MIGTKWVFKNKHGEDDEVVTNKTHLVAQDFSQVKGLDFGEIFAPVARLEVIMIILAFAAFKEFKLYQIDVKCDLLNGVIQEEVYVRQPPGFKNPKYHNRVYKLLKALYVHKQVPRTWYARLETFLLDHGYVMGSVDKTLFTLKYDNDFILVQIYMDDIILGGFLMCLCQVFRNDGERVPDVHDERTNIFLRHLSQANKEGHFHTSSQVHEGLDKKIQHD
jgi:hypothetical protein